MSEITINPSRCFEKMTPKKAVLLSQFDPGRYFPRPRLIIEGIRIWGKDLFLGIQYRKSRIFCRFGPEYTLQWKADERDLREAGLQSYRCFTVDPSGRMVIAGSSGDDTILIELSTEGEIAGKRILRGLRFTSALAYDPSGNLFVHSPALDQPLSFFSPGKGEERNDGVLLGKYPPGSSSVLRRKGLLVPDSSGNLLLVYENYPAWFHRYSPSGELLSEENLDADSSESPECRHLRILDISTPVDDDRIYLLRFQSDDPHTYVDCRDREGNLTGLYRMPRGVRCISGGGESCLYAGVTKFSLMEMLLKAKLYATKTRVIEFNLASGEV